MIIGIMFVVVSIWLAVVIVHNPMAVLLGLWVMFVFAGLNFMRSTIRASAGFLRIALFGFVDHRGVVVNWDARRRLLNGLAGFILPPFIAGVVLLNIIFIAGLLAQLR